MDIQQQTSQMSDDQELAKVLAGVEQQGDQTMQFEATPVSGGPKPDEDKTVLPTPVSVPIVGYNPPSDAPSAGAPSTPPVPAGDLESIKKEALAELRPLVDKLDLAPDEKFDAYLLLLRSTDDKGLIAPAYAAAQAIKDESRKAQALLDVIKEIDYFSAAK